MQELNLDVAGEFLVMAATLIHIKSRMLLPRPEPAAGDDGDEEDPREALVRRLLEHQKFKAAAELLHERETLRSAQWPRPDERVAADRRRRVRARARGRSLQPARRVHGGARAGEAAARRCCCRPSRSRSRRASSSCSTRLSETEACGFEDLFADVATRPDLIVTFLALLEMIRLKLVRVFQAGPFGPIRVYKRAAPGRRAASDWRSRRRVQGAPPRGRARGAADSEGTPE